MARNIFSCTKGRYGRLHCSFMKLAEDPETGRLEEKGCILKMKDSYRMYPEHNSDGSLIHNRVYGGSDPYPHGIDVIWENDTPHETGITFNRTMVRSRVEEYNMHPLYTIKDVNEPIVTGPIANDYIGWVFGENNAALCAPGWNNQEIRGMQRVEDCGMGIYGQWNKTEKIVLPKCLRDYSGDIKDWVNYTAIPSNPKKKIFFVCDEPNKKIVQYCQERFGKTTLSAIVYQILIAIKHGEFINLWEALINNGLTRSQTYIIMNEVSTKSKRTLYSNMNLMKYYYYWIALGKMDLPSEKVYLFRCHLLNYVLNYPPLMKMKPTGGTPAFIPPNRRFWWVVQMVKNANRHFEEHKQPMLTKFSELQWLFKLAEGLKENKNLENEHKSPAIETVFSIIGEHKKSPGFDRKIRVFSRILRAGHVWSPPEVKITWEYFVRAYDSKDPEKFWQYVESARTCSFQGSNNIRQEVGIINDDMDFTPQKAFSHHLLAARKSRKSFEVEETKLMERWGTITPKRVISEIDEDQPKIEYSDIFWNQLRRIWASGKNRFNYIFQTIRDNFSDLSNSAAEELAEMYQDELSEDVLLGKSISKDDIGRGKPTHIEDIDGNEEAQQWPEESAES